MKKLSSVLKIWFPLAVTISLVCFIIYIVVQQNYRLSANDPQYQIAEDAAYAISHGADPKSLIPATFIELSHSFAPYIIIYDENKNAVASSALLNGKIPIIPSGVLDYVKEKGEHALSWQPQPGIRQALVIKKTEGSKLYFVVAGRSLHRTEQRISLLGQQVAFGWLVSLVILFVVAWVQVMITSKKNL